ncbi:MAG: hypothetical protein QOJ27_525 [Sphingomonadales bacterium]|jgi:hypothetical protein|nr:hypothetical protein [Sphingomonadales bacterium]
MDNLLVAGRAAPLSQVKFDEANEMLGGDEASLWSLLTVETRGFGYLPDRRSKILFERHIFRNRTRGVFDRSEPDISNPVAGGYAGDAAEYPRLVRAMLRNRTAALDSASWGLGQVMGFNAAGLGYAGAEDMISLFRDSEDEQLEAAVRFITNNRALRVAFETRRWDRVAFFYNGRNFAKNDYHTKLARFHELYEARGVPSVAIRAAQARLAYLGFDPRGIDGRVGPGTSRAVGAFQRSQALPVTGQIADVEQALQAAAGV